MFAKPLNKNKISKLFADLRVREKSAKINLI
jgi:hypothetical protein